MPIAIPINENGTQVLVPAIGAGGEPLSEEQALAQYQASGQHYGKFDTAENARAYAGQLPASPASPAAPAPAAPAPAAPAEPAAATPAAPAPAAPAAEPIVGVNYPYGGTPPPAAPDALPPGTPDGVSRSQAARAAVLANEAEYQRRLKFIQDDPVATQRQKDHAEAIVTGEYRRKQGSISIDARQEAATVKQLMKDDESSIISSGVPITELTTERVSNALGEDEAARYAEQRAGSMRYYQNFHDMPNLTQGEIDQRLAETKPVPGAPGFSRYQQVHDFAQKNADALQKQRIVDPAGSVSTLPDVQEAAKTASLERPESFYPLVQARTAAMDRVGIPAANRVPLTNAEARELWKPIALASEGGKMTDIRLALTDVIQRLQIATKDQSNLALEAVLRAGHASHDTALTAAAVLKKLAVAQKPTVAETHAFDAAAKDAAAREAAVPIAIGPEGIPIYREDVQPSVAPAAPKITWPAPSDKAIQLLESQPALADQFNATYGPGSADKVLQIVRRGAAPRPPAAPAPASP